jgi:hypothetical protein
MNSSERKDAHPAPGPQLNEQEVPPHCGDMQSHPLMRAAPMTGERVTTPGKCRVKAQHQHILKIAMQSTLEPVTAAADPFSIDAEMAAYDANPELYRAELLAILQPPQRCRRRNRQAFKGQPVQ